MVNIMVLFIQKHPCFVKNIDLDEQISKTITADKSVQQLFDEPYFVSVITDKKTLYVSNNGKHSVHVTSMDITGTVQLVFKRYKLKRPCGLAVDR